MIDKYSIHPDLGKNIKFRRNALDISQSELAYACGVEAAVVSHYEAGSISPSLQVIIRMSSRLRCTVSDLLGQTNSPAIAICPTCHGRGEVYAKPAMGEGEKP